MLPTAANSFGTAIAFLKKKYLIVRFFTFRPLFREIHDVSLAVLCNICGLFFICCYMIEVGKKKEKKNILWEARGKIDWRRVRIFVDWRHMRHNGQTTSINKATRGRRRQFNKLKSIERIFAIQSKQNQSSLEYLLDQ